MRCGFARSAIEGDLSYSTSLTGRFTTSRRRLFVRRDVPQVSLLNVWDRRRNFAVAGAVDWNGLPRHTLRCASVSMHIFATRLIRSEGIILFVTATYMRILSYLALQKITHCRRCCRCCCRYFDWRISRKFWSGGHPGRSSSHGQGGSCPPGNVVKCFVHQQLQSNAQ